MPGRLFVLNCPSCGYEITIGPDGNYTCGVCGRGYLNRFGYLILRQPEPPLVDLSHPDNEAQNAT